MRVLLDFRTKPSYAPVIDLVNCLSEKHDVFLIPNKISLPIGLNNNVICCRDTDVHAVDPDVVFSTHSTLLAIAFLKAKLKLPIVNYMFTHMTLHDFLSAKFLALPNSYKLGKMLDLLAFSLPKKSLLMPCKLIVPNHMVKKSLIELGFPKDRIVVLPWGLDVTKYQSQKFSLPTSAFLKNNNDDLIVYTGPLHPLRFSTQLLYIFFNVLKQNTDAHLLLLFRKDLWHQRTYKKLVSAIQKLGLGKKVSIIMPSSHEAYLSLVSQATVVILPYFSSGMVEVPPFTLLECMALSKPVITSRGIVTCDIIENGINGFMIPENPSSLADLINFLIFNKRKARHMGQKARMTVQKKYSLTNFSSKLSHVLESCC